MSHFIASRISNYGPYAGRGWAHLAEIGVRHVEAPIPRTEAEEQTLAQRLREHGLAASSFQGLCDVARPDAAEALEPQLRTCRRCGVDRLFLSVKAGDADRAEVLARLRTLGERAAAHGVVLALETHPDLVTNGTIGRQTMEAVNHPNVRINFDTANVYYYNRGVTAPGELARVLEFVTSVHLKDTDGGYQSFQFPTLGRGVVDFPDVFRMLAARGFSGPCTMELERADMDRLDEAAVLAHAADSVAYLRSIGAMGA